MKKYIFLFFLTLAILAANEHLSIAQYSASSVQFLPIESGISQNTITDLVQDQKGFLWIGTRNGLNRYDGINIVSYYHDESDSTSLNNNYVRTLYVSKSGQLWVGTEGGGFAKYIELTDSFERYASDGSPASVSGNWIYSFYEDEFGNLWVGTQNNGLNVYNKKERTIVHYRKNSDDPFSISDNHVTGIVQDKFNNIWVSTWGGGMNMFDRNTKRFIHYAHDPNDKKSISSDVIRELYIDDDQNIFVGTDEGIDKLIYTEQGRFVFDRIKLSIGQSEPVVLSIIKDQNKNLWVGTENNGVIRIDHKSGNIDHFKYNPKYEYSIQNNSIWSIYEDRKGIVWVGTYNKGLFKLGNNLRKFRSLKHSTYYYNSLSNNSVSSFAEDKYSNIWVGTDGGGLDYWNRKTNAFKHFNQLNGYPIKNEVLALMIDSKEDLWIGTWYGGLMIKKDDSNQIVPFKIDHPIISEPHKENIFSIMEDSKGRIWIAAYRQGLIMYDSKNNIFKGFEYDEWDKQSISSNYVRTTIEDKKGRIWIGTEGGGLNLLIEENDEFHFKNFLNNANNSISSNSVLSILPEGQDGLWVGTTAGLNYLEIKTNSWTTYGKKNGLPDEVIYAIERDDISNLWLSSNKGLSKFNIKSKDIRNYDEQDGLQGQEFFKNSSFKLKSGELLFGGVGGLNVFHPDEIKDGAEEPPVYLSGFNISNKRVVSGPNSPIKEALISASQIDLNHDQNDFSFEFALLSFNQSNRNEYGYQLVNYDKEWQEVGNRREAYYTNVPPGDYTFRVKGTTNDGNWSSNEAFIDVHIASPWYKSNIAYTIYFVTILIVLFITFRTIVNRERLHNQLRIDQMELTKMQELDEMKSSFFANISHEFRSPLTLILGPLKVLKEKKDFHLASDHIDMMIRNAESLLNLINQLLELSKLESGKMRMEVVEDNIVEFLKPIVHSFSSLANQKFINYKVSWPKKDVKIYFDREKLEKIMFNLISNALKFTSDFGNILIQLKEHDDQVSISVIDNGIGIPKDELSFVFNRYYRVRSSKKSKGTGIGLSLTKELVEVHSGKIEVESKEGKGSTFTVYLKKGGGHFNKEDVVSTEREEYLFERKRKYGVNKKIKKQTTTEAIESFEDQISNFPMILVVEDNQDILKYIKNIFAEEYTILEAENGKQGLEVAMEKIPDIVISDIMMPGMNGYELCEKLKSDIKTSHIPVVLLTAKASNDSAEEGFEVGADYYITKPFNPKLLSLRVRNALKTKQQIKDQLLKSNEFELEPSKLQIASKDEVFLNKAISIVEENMSNSEFYVDDLGKELGLSRMQLYRKLKALIGQSANEFVRSIRLKRAAQLISQDQLTISEITYQVGFNDLQYFRDCFKKQFGINPSEYGSQSKNKVV